MSPLSIMPRSTWRRRDYAGDAPDCGRATTARVAPNSLRAKAAAERSQTQKKVIVFSIAIAIVAVIAWRRRHPYHHRRRGSGRAPRADSVVAHDGERCKWRHPVARSAGTGGRHARQFYLYRFVLEHPKPIAGHRFLYGQQWHAVRHDRLKPNDWRFAAEHGRPDERHHVGNGRSRQQQQQFEWHHIGHDI